MANNYYIIDGYGWTGYDSLSVVASEDPLAEACSLEGVTRVTGTPSVAIAEQSEWYYGRRVKTTIFVKGAIELPSYQDQDGIWGPTLVPESAFWALPELKEYLRGSQVLVHGEFATPVTERTVFRRSLSNENEFYEDSTCGRFLVEQEPYFFFEGRFLTAFEIGELVNEWREGEYSPESWGSVGYDPTICDGDDDFVSIPE